MCVYVLHVHVIIHTGTIATRSYWDKVRNAAKITFMMQSIRFHPATPPNVMVFIVIKLFISRQRQQQIHGNTTMMIILIERV